MYLHNDWATCICTMTYSNMHLYNDLQQHVSAQWLSNMYLYNDLQQHVSVQWLTATCICTMTYSNMYLHNDSATCICTMTYSNMYLFSLQTRMLSCRHTHFTNCYCCLPIIFSGWTRSGRGSWDKEEPRYGRWWRQSQSFNSAQTTESRTRNDKFLWPVRSQICTTQKGKEGRVIERQKNKELRIKPYNDMKTEPDWH